MKKLKTSILFKIGVILLLVLILLIPTTMVKNIISEREWVRKEAIAEVSEKWGNGQTIIGPYLAIPFDQYTKQYSKKDSAYKLIKETEYLYILPEVLKTTGKILPEKRKRGIYEVVVYESDFEMKGVFSLKYLKELDIPAAYLHLDKASLNVGISDLKGIEKQIQLAWNTDKVFFNSGTTTNDIAGTGINASVPVADDSTNYNFMLQLDLKGSQFLYFTPVGKTTDVELTSPWTTPSFTGTYLPDDRAVDEAGFTAKWNVLHLNRNFPQFWTGRRHDIDGTTFGTDLLLPVDSYQKSMRVAKYAILFLALTFMVFFFVEVLNKVFIHPIQYLLVGIALVVFYTLLLSLSEHVVYNVAYLISTLLTLSLVTFYTMAILKSKKLGMLIFGILSILYLFIFTIIQLEDYALLIGSLGVFIILTIVMYFSRKIDWYSIKIGEE